MIEPSDTSSFAIQRRSRKGEWKTHMFKHKPSGYPITKISGKAWIGNRVRSGDSNTYRLVCIRQIVTVVP